MVGIGSSICTKKCKNEEDAYIKTKPIKQTLQSLIKPCHVNLIPIEINRKQKANKKNILENQYEKTIKENYKKNTSVKISDKPHCSKSIQLPKITRNFKLNTIICDNIVNPKASISNNLILAKNKIRPNILKKKYSISNHISVPVPISAHISNTYPVHMSANISKPYPIPKLAHIPISTSVPISAHIPIRSHISNPYHVPISDDIPIPGRVPILAHFPLPENVPTSYPVPISDAVPILNNITIPVSVPISISIPIPAPFHIQTHVPRLAPLPISDYIPNLAQIPTYIPKLTSTRDENPMQLIEILLNDAINEKKERNQLLTDIKLINSNLISLQKQMDRIENKLDSKYS